MYGDRQICVIVPAYNEEPSIGTVLEGILALTDPLSSGPLVDQVIVCDNGSTDDTAKIVARYPCVLVSEPTLGYGAACQAALDYPCEKDIVVFVDADCSVKVDEMPALLAPIADGADLVIGARISKYREPGALTAPQRFGNWLAGTLIRLLWQRPVTDLGPFRAVRWEALEIIDMQDRKYGWTIEMQVRAIQEGLVMVEVPVSSLKRIGRSKISGTVSGVIGAGFGILGKLFRLFFQEQRHFFSPKCGNGEICIVKAARLAGMAVFLAVSYGFSWLFSGPAAELDPFWDLENSTSTVQVDHSLWQSVLDDYLVQDESGVNLFDYEGLQIDGDQRLDQYVSDLSEIDPRNLNRAEQMSYWINLYNALTVRLVTKNYPVASITELGGSLLGSGPWDDKIITLAGRALTLNDIEHRILRPVFKDHRIHFAVNCASMGCPNLNAGVYTGGTLDQLLSQAAKRFLGHPRGLQFEGDTLRLSKIFRWFQDDFGSDEQEMLHTLSLYAEPDIALRIRRFRGEVKYDYDWALNDLQ